MVIASKPIIALVVGLSALAFASPSMAQRREEHPDHISAARAAAIHECNLTAVSRFGWFENGNRDQVYRACMAEHGERE
jgi:hypothetical protein